MRIYDKRLVFTGNVKNAANLLDTTENFLRRTLALDEDFLRYAIVEADKDKKIIEAAVLSGIKEKRTERRQLWDPQLNSEKFVVANIVPTGVRAEFGGWIGDATPITNVLAGLADVVITHPNVLNAAFLNYGAKNILYTEGYLLDQFFRNQIVLKDLGPSGIHNKIGVILDKGALEADKECLNIAINTIEALRAVAGIDVVDYLITEEPVGGKSIRMTSGAFGGTVENPRTFLGAAAELIKRGAQAIAIATYILVSLDDLNDYFEGKIPNPYGGTEALISHTISREFNIPSAHAPILPEIEKRAITSKGLVDPRAAAEAVSTGYLGSVLKGLHYAPQPVSRSLGLFSSAITLNDVRAVIVPYSCCGGIPVLAAQKYNIPVIAVKENKTILDVTAEKLGLNNVIVVENYLEAFGIISTMRTGVALEAVRRPLVSLKRREQYERKK